MIGKWEKTAAVAISRSSARGRSRKTTIPHEAATSFIREKTLLFDHFSGINGIIRWWLGLFGFRDWVRAYKLGYL